MTPFPIANVKQKRPEEYSTPRSHSFNRGDGFGDRLTIDGDVYSMEVDSEGRKILRRYNKKYKTWVNIEFLGESGNLENVVKNYLKNQYLKNNMAKS